MILMTPAQHRQWAENARRVNRPDLAKHHEQLARAIEIKEQRRLSRQEVEPRKKCPALAGLSVSEERRTTAYAAIDK